MLKAGVNSITRSASIHCLSFHVTITHTSHILKTLKSEMLGAL